MKVRVSGGLVLSLFVFMLAAAPAAGQQADIPLSSFEYDNAPFKINESVIRINPDGGFQVICSIENTGETEITSMDIWALVYFKNRPEPKLLVHKWNKTVGKEPELLLWSEPADPLGTPVSGVIAPHKVYLSDNTQWTLKKFYNIDKVGASLLEAQFKFPEVGLVTDLSGDVGVIRTGYNYDLFEGQMLGIIRTTGDQTERIAQIKVMKNFPVRSGFETEYKYPGKQIKISDKAQFLFPGMSRLNGTARNLFCIGGLSAAAGGYFHYIKNDSEDNITNAPDQGGINYYTAKTEKYLRRRDAAFVTAGAAIGGALLSELIWGKPGSHLYPAGRGSLNPATWNTTNKTLITTGIVSLAGAAYYRNQRETSESIIETSLDLAKTRHYIRKYNSANHKLDVSLILAGTSVGSGLINQLIFGNSWPFVKSGRSWRPCKWSPVSRSLFITSMVAGAEAGYFYYMKNYAEDRIDKAIDLGGRIHYVKLRDRSARRRDAAFVIGGASFTGALIHQLFFSPNPDDLFDADAIIPSPNLPKLSCFFAGITAASGGMAFYFYDRANYNQKRIEDALDPAGKAFYTKAEKDNIDRRNIMLASAGVSAGGALISYLLLRNKGERPSGTAAGSTSRYSFETDINPWNASVGFKFRF